MKLKDKEAWKKWVDGNDDSYGNAIIRYTERWADLMEEHLAKGENLGDVAKETSHKADMEGITGFMYGAAVSMLSQVWEHGEALRQWHNLDTQIGSEGEKANKSDGVLNPALMNIGTKSG